MKYTLIALAAVVVIGGASYALVPRSVLKEFFQSGDKPTGAQFESTIDSEVSAAETGGTSNGLKDVNAAKVYTEGDTKTVPTAPTERKQAKVLSESQKTFVLDVNQSATFRWAPVSPKPNGNVNYKIKVWQLMQGQNGTQAMRENKPIVEKDVANASEVTVNGILTGPCKPPYLCDFIWSVEAVSAADTKTGSGSVEATTQLEATLPKQSGGSTDGTR